jgi:MFS family permease
MEARMNSETARESEAPVDPRRRRVLAATCLAHMAHDGLSDMLFVFFPVWQPLFALSYAQVGLMKTVYSGAMALLQIPAGRLTAGLGLRATLTGGMLLAGLALFLSGSSETALGLGALLTLGGVASSAQHARSSGAIAQTHRGKSSRVALSTYNFTGDIGKLLMPALAGLLLAHYAWQPAIRTLALAGMLAGVVMFFLLRGADLSPERSEKSEPQAEPQAEQLADLRANRQAGRSSESNTAFLALCSIGVLDSATRMVFLTFLPFLLRGKGSDMTTLGLALGLIFAGGMVGKLVCGVIATRLGPLRSVIITEGCTSLLIVCLTPLPVWGALCLCPLLGVVLNGTSSVLYGSVPELVGKRSLNGAFALYYTATLGSGAVSPFLFGMIGDTLGIQEALLAAAAAILLTIPLTLPLRGRLARECGG